MSKPRTATPAGCFTKTEVARRFRAARKSLLGGRSYIIQFQDRGYGLPVDQQRLNYCIEPGPLGFGVALAEWRNSPDRDEWSGDYRYGIEEWGALPYGFVLDCCRYVPTSLAERARGADPIVELHDNAYVWLGTPTDNPKVYIFGEGWPLHDWKEVPYK